MKVKAKFKVDSVEAAGEGRNIHMSAVIDGSDENKEWSKWTPSGSLQMGVTTDAFADAKPGDQFYLTFEKAE